MSDLDTRIRKAVADLVDSAPPPPPLPVLAPAIARRPRRFVAATLAAAALAGAVAITAITPGDQHQSVVTGSTPTESSVLPPQQNTTGRQLPQSTVLAQAVSAQLSHPTRAAIKTMPAGVIYSALTADGYSTGLVDDPEWIPVDPTDPVDVVALSGQLLIHGGPHFQSWVVEVINPLDGAPITWAGSTNGTWPPFFDALPNQTGQQPGTSPAVTDPATAADLAERNTLTRRLNVTGGIFRSITSVQIKRMTWATLASISNINGTPDVSITPSSYVYVTLRTGSFGEEGNPTANDPWYLVVFSATAPYQLLVITTGQPGGPAIPAWFVSAPDTYAS